MISAAIYSIISSNIGITDLVSTRIFPQSAPLNTQFPLIVFTHVSKVPTNTKDGGSVVDESRVQVDIYSKNHPEAGSINDAIRTALDGYQNANIQGHNIDRIYFERQSEAFDEEQQVYRISTDFFIREHKI